MFLLQPMVVANVLLPGSIFRSGDTIQGAICPAMGGGGGAWQCVKLTVALECDELIPAWMLTKGTVIPDATRRLLLCKRDIAKTPAPARINPQQPATLFLFLALAGLCGRVLRWVMRWFRRRVEVSI